MICFAVFMLPVGLVLSELTSQLKHQKNQKKTTTSKIRITEDFFNEEILIHAAEHEVIKMLVPLSTIHLDYPNSSKSDPELFFVEADFNHGVKEYKGLSILKNKQTKKLLETGTDVSTNYNTKTALFGATDGLYVYNDKTKTAEKYGSITDSIIGLAIVNGFDIIYILTNNKELYRVTGEGTMKNKMNYVVGAQQIALDNSNNLYYYDADKQVYVVSKDGVKRIEGLPSNPTYVNLLEPPFMVDFVVVIVNDKSFFVFANGSSEIIDIEFAVQPTAYGLEGPFFKYFAYNRCIYQYNVVAILAGSLIEDLQKEHERKP